MEFYHKEKLLSFYKGCRWKYKTSQRQPRFGCVKLAYFSISASSAVYSSKEFSRT